MYYLCTPNQIIGLMLAASVSGKSLFAKAMALERSISIPKSDQISDPIPYLTLC